MRLSAAAAARGEPVAEPSESLTGPEALGPEVVAEPEEEPAEEEPAPSELPEWDVEESEPPEPAAAGGDAGRSRRPPSDRAIDPSVEPTERELRISIRVLLHIARQGRFGPEELPSDALTQAGMAQALGASQGAISNCLGRLVHGGALTSERSHVAHRMFRVTVYTLTPSGEELVRRLRRRFGPRT